MARDEGKRRLGDLLGGRWSVGEPAVNGVLAAYPVFGPPALHRFASLRAAMRGGLVARELPARASRDDLWIDNPTPSPTLVFGGEQLYAGAEPLVCHESWLVDAGRRTWVPVCRIGTHKARRTRLASFSVGDRICAPRVRRYEAFLARTRGTPGYGATRAPLPQLLDEMVERERRVDEDDVRHFVLHEGQGGAVFAIGDRFVAFDWVARPGVYADLHRGLVRGCLLDTADEQRGGQPPSVEQARRWLDVMRDLPVTVQESKHAARSVRPRVGADGRARVEGAGIALDGALLQWSAFAPG